MVLLSALFLLPLIIMLSSMDLCFFVIVSGCGWADSFSFNEPLLLLDLAIVGLFFLLYLWSASISSSVVFGYGCSMDVVVSAHFVLMWLWMWYVIQTSIIIAFCSMVGGFCLCCACLLK